MELVRSNLVFVGAFELVHHDDGYEHDRCEDSYNPLGFPSKTKGIDFLRLGFLNELVVLAVVESLQQHFMFENYVIGQKSLRLELDQQKTFIILMVIILHQSAGMVKWGAHCIKH